MMMIHVSLVQMKRRLSFETDVAKTRQKLVEVLLCTVQLLL